MDLFVHLFQLDALTAMGVKMKKAHVWMPDRKEKKLFLYVGLAMSQ
jgi:hypothetical protein